MFRSIRFTLLFWYAVILLGSVAVLGSVLHRELRSTLYREADSQHAQWLEVVQRLLGRHAPAPGDAAIAAAIRGSLPAAATFAVFDAAGALRAVSAGYAPVAPPQRAETTTRDDRRWRSESLPDAGGWLLVGRSVRDENHAIRSFLIVLLATGAGIVALALAGGYLLVSCALAPTRTIAQTAQRISANNLGSRIPVTGVPSELRAMVTTLNESFARLEQTFAAQAAFTADASHELRTPLAIVLSHLELATAPGQTESQLRERLAICHDAGKRMEALVAGLLTLARADAGAVPFVAVPVDLGALADEQVAAMEPLAARRGIAIERRIEATIVTGEADRLREVLGNLIDNAIRYNRDGGRVTVTVANEGADAVLRVLDTGIGIADEHRARVFERFFRADPARSRAQGGSGLGLPIVRWIVERHGGSITVGGRLGEGAVFVVRLPRARPAR